MGGRVAIWVDKWGRAYIARGSGKGLFLGAVGGSSDGGTVK